MINNHKRSIGDTFWENIRCATAYSEADFAALSHLRSSEEIKPCLETLDLVDTTWTDKSSIQKLRDDLELHLKHRHTYLEEKHKRDNRKFKTKNFITDKNFEAVKDRDRSSAISSIDVLNRFTRIDFSSRQIKITDDATMSRLFNVKELVLADNDINFVTSLPPRVQLAVLSSNEIHRVQLSYPAHNLVALCIAGNCISSLSFVDQLPSLACLDISFNCISAPIETNVACRQVAEHKNLQELHLQGNPLCISCLDWRKKVEVALVACGSQIRNLDGKVINPAAASSARKSSVVTMLPAAGENNNQEASSAPAATSITAAPSFYNSSSSSQYYSDLSILFQVLNVRGISDLTQKFFDLNAASSSALSTFLTPTILDSFNYQFTSPNPQYGGLNMVLANAASGSSTAPGSPITQTNAAGASSAAANKKLAAAQQQQQAAALAANPSLGNPGLQATHEAILAQWCKEISTSLSVQLLWLQDEEKTGEGKSEKSSQDSVRVLHLDELMALGGATNAAGEDLTEEGAAVSSAAAGQNDEDKNTSAAATGKNKKSTASSSKTSSKSAKDQKSSAGATGKSSSSSSAAKQEAKEASAAALREQQLQNALQLASSEFVLPSSRPTLCREVMLPARLGLVLTVVPTNATSALFNAIYNNNNSNNNNSLESSTSTKELPPTATLGWASLSPADLISGYTTTTTATGIKLGVDRATLLTAKERVNKLRTQLTQIRTSLEKEIAENSWRRDTEQAILMSQSDRHGPGGAGKSSKMDKSQVGGRRGGNLSGRGAQNHQHLEFSPAPSNPNTNDKTSLAQIQNEMELFFQNQIALRRRAEETYKKLVVEMAVLNVLEGLSEFANGKVVVDGKFKLQKASAEALKKVLGDDEQTNKKDNGDDHHQENGDLEQEGSGAQLSSEGESGRQVNDDKKTTKGGKNAAAASSIKKRK